MISLLILGIFANIKVWSIGAILSAILGIGIVKNKALLVDKAAKFVSKWSGKIYLFIEDHGDIFLNIKNTSDKIDEAISEDGSTNLNTLKEALELGKKVKVELEDMIIEIKPKK